MAQVSGLLYQYISPFANFIAGILGTLITIICIYMVSDPKLSEVPEKEENKLSTVVVMKELVHNIPFMLFLVISFFFWGACSTNFNYLSLFIKSQGGTASQVGTYQLFATLFEIPMILATDYIIKKIPYRYIMMFAIIMSMINFAWYATLPSVNTVSYTHLDVYKRQLVSDAKEGAKQIIDNKYEDEIINDGYLHVKGYGISFYKKYCYIVKL